jgi:hypothetical protein
VPESVHPSPSGASVKISDPGRSTRLQKTVFEARSGLTARILAQAVATRLRSGMWSS